MTSIHISRLLQLLQSQCGRWISSAGARCGWALKVRRKSDTLWPSRNSQSKTKLLRIAITCAACLTRSGTRFSRAQAGDAIGAIPRSLSSPASFVGNANSNAITCGQRLPRGSRAFATSSKTLRKLPISKT